MHLWSPHHGHKTGGAPMVLVTLDLSSTTRNQQRKKGQFPLRMPLIKQQQLILLNLWFVIFCVMKCKTTKHFCYVMKSDGAGVTAWWAAPATLHLTELQAHCLHRRGDLADTFLKMKKASLPLHENNRQCMLLMISLSFQVKITILKNFRLPPWAGCQLN